MNYPSEGRGRQQALAGQDDAHSFARKGALAEGPPDGYFNARHLWLVAARWLGTVALALWLGGLVGIGALVAPVTAHFLTAHPALDPTVKAGLLTAIVGGSLRVFNILCDVCGVLLLVSQWGLWKQTPRRVALCGLLVTVLLLASALYLGLGLFPQMDAAQAAGQMNLFDSLHHRYEAFSTQLQLPLLLVLAACFALRDTPRHETPNS